MRLTTAEIKMLLRQCAADGEIHSIEAFKRFIAERTEKNYSVGQLSGALAQLAALGELENVERGLYRSKKAGSGAGGDRRVYGPCVREEKDEGKQNKELREQIRTCLEETEERLARIAGAANVWELSSEDFELLGETRRLSERMKAVMSKC